MNILYLLFSLFWFFFLMSLDTLFEGTSYLHHMHTLEHNLRVLYSQQFGIICMLDVHFKPLRS